MARSSKRLRRELGGGAGERGAGSGFARLGGGGFRRGMAGGGFWRSGASGGFSGLRLLLLVAIVLSGVVATAHPMPNSLIMLDVKEKTVQSELQLPVSELELALGHPYNRDSIEAYVLAHFRPVTMSGESWRVVVNSVSLDTTQQVLTGKYSELKIFLTLTPPPNTSTQHFILNYDVIMHQLITHKAIIYVREDANEGVTGGNGVAGVTGGNANFMGVISLDVKNNTFHPFVVELQKGSGFKGFLSMFELGMSHIAEGADHLLFLLVLLLPAPTLGIKGLTRIVTAFTIGHSLTLILGALDIIRLPARPVEVLIAFSILVTAVHCLRPFFTGKEMVVAAGFGFVHGLAFSTVLANLRLPAGEMALSILGFNLGIEAMQLVVVLVVFPVLVWLGRRPLYFYVKRLGAVAAIGISIFWIVERLG